MKLASIVALSLASGVTLGAFAQERVKPKGPPDFETLHAGVAEHWKAERWGACYAGARDLIGVVALRRAKGIRDAMPEAPEGYEKVVEKEETNPQATAMMAAMTAGIGNVIEQRYRGRGKEIRITATADSPMLQMFRMMIQNAAVLQPNQELIKYTECNALLETEGSKVTLRLLLDDSLVEAVFQGHDADYVLGIVNQASVTKLHKAITN